jgi:hypothetical protein
MALVAITGLLVGSGLAGAQDRGVPGEDHAAATAARAEQARLAAIQANRDRTISELMGMWAPHEGASQLEVALQAASARQLLQVSEAASFAEVEKVLLGETAGASFAIPNTLGDTTQDYVFTSVTPCRIFDTRNAVGAFAANTTREFYVYGPAGDITPQGGNAAGCPAPAGKGDPRAVHIQVSVVPVGSPGNVRVYPANETTPNTSVVSFVSGLNFSNALTVGTYYAIGPKEIEVYVGNSSAHVIADVMGYYYNVTGLSNLPGVLRDSGFAVASGTTPSATLAFLAPPATVTVNSSTQVVHIVSNKAFGATLGASDLYLRMCYRVAGSAALPTIIGGSGAYSGPQALPADTTRIVMGLSANVSGLAAGDYSVGLCGTGSANWNYNEWGYTTALVFNAP